jgi:Bardet-Biedl syndrome 4 protein
VPPLPNDETTLVEYGTHVSCCLQAATCLSPHNVQNLKQVGRSLYLLGKHRQAIEVRLALEGPCRFLLSCSAAPCQVYEEALRIAPHDWEIWHNKGQPGDAS